MKAGHLKTTATTEEVSSPPGENGRWGPKMGSQHFPVRGKPLANRKKDLQIYEAARK
jgi:hypothetical protein